jgi:hypothetical protein
MSEQRNAAQKLAELARALSEQSEWEGKPAIDALIGAAHTLGVPTNARRDDAPVFLVGTEPIETATWTQCGGLLFSLAHDELTEARAVAARVAGRIAALLPAHLARENDTK